MGIGIREFARRASVIVERVEATGRPELITRDGKPVAALIPVDDSGLDDWILSNAPEFVQAMREADQEIAQGTRGRPLDEVLAEIEIEGTPERPRHARARS